MFRHDTVLERTGELVSAPMGEDLATMDLDSGTYYVLRPVAALIWQELASTTLAALCDRLHRQ